MPVFRFDKALGIARGVKAFFSKDTEGSIARGSAVPDDEPREEPAGNPERVRRLTSEHRKKLRSEIRSKKRELSERRNGPVAKDGAERAERKKRKKLAQQELFQLQRELRVAKEQLEKGVTGGGPSSRVEDESGTGALPDFVIIGAKKSGTTSLYHLLSRHPLVEPAASKELHFFDVLFEQGVEWYRSCFPKSRSVDGRETITGEATPGYLFYPAIPERMAQVIPDARLIALLRNPVDRAYSDYQHQVRQGWETGTFDEAVEEAMELLGKEGDAPEPEDRRVSINIARHEYLSKGIYVDQLSRWSEFFTEERLLILKSEDLFEHPRETLKVTLDFLALPEWEPDTWEIRKKGRYEEGMDPATRHKLEEFFEPHNRRLYEFLGRDLGW